MIVNKNRLSSVILFFLIAFPKYFAQVTSVDCKSSDIGPIRVNVSNTGNMNKAFMGDPDCAYWDNEYPIGSDNVYGPWGIWIGADNNVSEGGPWATPDIANEFFPSSFNWDTVWVVDRSETVDIPYWPNYTGVSDRDFVCRYNDYSITQGLSLPGAVYEGHSPLYIDVIQVTYTWTSLEFIVNQYWVIPNGFDLDLYFGIAGNMQGGDGFVAVGDDFCTFDHENKFAIIEDLPGGGDDWNYAGPIGFRIVSDFADSMMTWHYHDSYREAFFPPTDIRKFNIMRGPITHDPTQTSLGFAHVYYGAGPFSIGNGDTLHLTVGQIHGQGFDGLYSNLESFYNIKDQKYRTPSAPPMPPIRIEPDIGKVTLLWDALPGETNPETYTDQYRFDGDPAPFEGYRIYKSMTGIGGPWVLLGEYDLINSWGYNFGIRRSLTDVGLLNNFTYLYSVTAFSKPDTVIGSASMESSLIANIITAVPGAKIYDRVGSVAVVPNPYRGDLKYYNMVPPWEGSYGRTWTEENRRVQFINLPNLCTIRIFTVSGKFINKIYHDDPYKGVEDWNLTSIAGQAISSGIYLFTVEDSDKNTQTGKFIVIK